MNLRQAIRAEHSKRQTKAIADYVDGDPKRFAQLMEIFFEGEYRMTQRASWPMNYCAERHPELVYPYLDKLLMLLADKGVHNAVRRNIARLLQFIEIPEKNRGEVYALCVEVIDDTTEAVAVRAHAMTIAANIADLEPDLYDELRLVVKKHIPHATAGFRARARRIL